MPKQTLASLSTKVQFASSHEPNVLEFSFHIITLCLFMLLSFQVVLNQIVLGPCVIAIIFAWNNLWLGKLSELPSKYQNDALPTLLNGNSA
jgi:hypothetical protein